MWIENADRDIQFFVDNPHGLREIGIVCHDDQLVTIVAESIDKHVRGNIDVGSFFFHLHDLNGSRPAHRRIGERHPWLALQEMTIVNGEVRDRFQRANKELLPVRHMRIGRRRFHGRREVANPIDANARENF